MFVRGGDGALTRTRVVARGCAGDGAVVWLVSSTHTRRAYMPSLVICAALFSCVRLVSLRGYRWRHQRVGFLFVCLFGVPLFMSLAFPSEVVPRLFLPFWFAHAGVRVGQWSV